MRTKAMGEIPSYWNAHLRSGNCSCKSFFSDYMHIYSLYDQCRQWSVSEKSTGTGDIASNLGCHSALSYKECVKVFFRLGYCRADVNILFQSKSGVREYRMNHVNSAKKD